MVRPGAGVLSDSVGQCGQVWAGVAVDGDQIVLVVEAMHLDQLPGRRGAVDHEQRVVVVGIELGALPELLGVFDCQRVKSEGVAQQHRGGVLVQAGQVQPKAGGGFQEALDVLRGDLGLGAVHCDQMTFHGGQFVPPGAPERGCAESKASTRRARAALPRRRPDALDVGAQHRTIWREPSHTPAPPLFESSGSAFPTLRPHGSSRAKPRPGH